MRNRRTAAFICLFFAGNLSVQTWAQEIDGAAAYATHCARCHQSDGKGIQGQYPSLHDNAALWEDRSRGIHALLSGRTAEDVGEADMPTHGYLGNEIIAATLTYSLQTWGPGGEAFTTEEVAEERMKLVRGHPWDYAQDYSTSPLADMPAAEDRVASAGPAMTTDEFARARELYYARCTGCHGVTRIGTAGSALTPTAMRERGTEYLKAVINYGAVSGMPGWGTSGALDPKDLDLLARFLQHPVPEAPDLNEREIRETWQLHTPTADRPVRSQHPFPLAELFAVILHDTAQVAFIHGPTRKIIGTAATGRAPHRLRRSASGRYLYVISRDGTLSLIDLYFATPQRVAQVRVGYEARAVGVSRHAGYEDRYALAGAYWPPQLVLVDGKTLEPRRVVSTRGRTSTDGRYHPEPRVTDIAGSFAHPEFVAHIKETGRTYLFPYHEGKQLELADLETPGELRAGSYSTDRRHYLTPSDRNAVVVVDTLAREVVANVPARVFAGSMGTSYVDPEFGPVWLTSKMTTNEIIAIGTDPDAHPEFAWKLVRQLQGASEGSLFSATHPSSTNIWVDTPLSRDPRASQSVAVFDKRKPESGYRRVPVAQQSGIVSGPRQVLQPTFDSTGREVWLLVFNPADLTSAIVVVDDKSLSVATTITDPRIVTPIRIYSLADLPQSHGAAGSAARGADLYQDNCAICHGTFGEGDGALAPELEVVLQDLRYLSARNAGVFPRRFVTEIVDGRASRAAHGPAGMPVWGDVFATGSEDQVTRKINDLVDYVQSIQRPAEQ